MRTFFAAVCILFLITGCTTPSKTVSSSVIPAPPEPVPVEPPPEEYEINGYVKSEDGHPESSISVTFKNRTGETTQTKTNDEGYFTLSIKGKGHLHINDSDNNPLFVKTVNPVIFLKERGFIKIGKNEYNPKDKISVVLPNSVWGAKYRNIKKMYEAEDYKQVIDIGRQFIVEYKDIKDAPTSEVESIISVAQNKINEKEKQAKEKAEAEKQLKEMVKTFETVINLNKQEDYHSVISEGKEYLEKYRSVKGSRWEEIEKLVSEAPYRKMGKDFLEIITLNKNKNENYESIIIRGENYIKEYREVNNSKWNEIVNLVKDAEIVKKTEEEKEKIKRMKKNMKKEFWFVTSLNMHFDYELVITQGNNYIEKYHNVENSEWKTVKNLIKDAQVIAKEKKKEAIKEEFEVVALNNELNLLIVEIGFYPMEDDRGTISYFPSIKFRFKNVGIRSIPIKQVRVIYKNAYNIIYVDKISINQKLLGGRKSNIVISNSKFGYSGRHVFSWDPPLLAAELELNDEVVGEFYIPIKVKKIKQSNEIPISILELAKGKVDTESEYVVKGYMNHSLDLCEEESRDKCIKIKFSDDGRLDMVKSFLEGEDYIYVSLIGNIPKVMVLRTGEDSEPEPRFEIKKIKFLSLP